MSTMVVYGVFFVVVKVQVVCMGFVTRLGSFFVLREGLRSPMEHTTLSRESIVNRTYRTHNNLYISLFLLTTFGPIYCGPPVIEWVATLRARVLIFSRREACACVFFSYGDVHLSDCLCIP